MILGMGQRDLARRSRNGKGTITECKFLYVESLDRPGLQPACDGRERYTSVMTGMMAPGDVAIYRPPGKVYRQSVGQSVAGMTRCVLSWRSKHGRT